MRRYILLLLSLILVQSVFAAQNNLDCRSLNVQGICLNFILKSTSDKGTDFKNYNFPFNLKQGDELWIDKLEIFNKEKTRSTESTFYFNIMPKEGQITQIFSSNFGEYIIKIPPLNPKEEYVLVYDYETSTYNTYLNGKQTNGTFGHWRIDLYKGGEWIIVEKTEGLSAYTSIINGGWDNKLLLVQVNPLVKIFGLYKDDLKDLLLIILAMGGIFVPYFIYKKELKNKKEYDLGIQRDLLNSVGIILNDIEKGSEAHKKNLNKKPSIVPSFFLHLLDSNFYIPRIQHMINEHETKKLKDLIIQTSNKIYDINNLIQLAQNFDSRVNTDTRKNQHVIELKRDNFKYHSHLENLMKELKTELNNIKNNEHKKNPKEKVSIINFEANLMALVSSVFASLVVLYSLQERPNTNLKLFMILYVIAGVFLFITQITVHYFLHRKSS